MVKLPSDVVIIDFITYSWLKNKKRWENNKRLRKKFLRNYYKYLPISVIEAWNLVTHDRKAINEIMRQEDVRVFSIIRKAAGYDNKPLKIHSRPKINQCSDSIC